jgi:hypothetical protein
MKPFTHRIGIPVPVIRIRHRILSDVLKSTVYDDDDDLVKQMHSREQYYKTLGMSTSKKKMSTTPDSPPQAFG